MLENTEMMKRHSANPILTRNDIKSEHPLLQDVSSIFNPGAIKLENEYLLITRVQSRSRETSFVLARSHDGILFTTETSPIVFKGFEVLKPKVFHIYDARITAIDGRFYIMFAMDMEGECNLGLAVTDDFKNYDFLGIVSDEDIRNGVLFPEKVNGKYLRYDRPNKSRHTGGPSSGSVIWLSESDDLLKWKPIAPVLEGRFHYWDEFIGSGPAPVKTRAGWLHIYHGVATHFGSANIYQAGVALFDLIDPSKLLGRSRHNILEPRELYELTGQVPNVVFPSGWIVEEFDNEGYALENSEVKVYYGAADTSIGLAFTSIAELIRATGEGEIGS